MSFTLPSSSTLRGTNTLATDSVAGRAVLVAAATGLMALAAHVSLPLPFSPVPLTLQTFAVLLIGLTLGPASAFAAMLLYLAEGAAGLPVFSPQGPGGLAQLLGPTAGFLVAYPFAAAAAGWLARHLRIASPFNRALAAATLASVIIFACGATWLAALLHLHPATAWHLAVAPFLPGEAIKLLAVATLYRTMNRFQRS